MIYKITKKNKKTNYQTPKIIGKKAVVHNLKKNDIDLELLNNNSLLAALAK
jgi:hypothetical protein